MKNCKLLLLSFLLNLSVLGSINANEPALVFELKNGTQQRYNINDIEEINIANACKFSKLRFYSTNSEYQSLLFTKDIQSIKLLNGIISVELITETKTFPLAFLDSIAFLYVNDYNTVTINGREWMKQNLDVDHYRNGDPIPEIKNPVQWSRARHGAWCYLNNDTANGTKYGKIYNYYAVTDPRGFAPEGWMIAGKAQWAEVKAAAKNKEMNLCDSAAWAGMGEFAKTANDMVGFSALPGGYREVNGNYSQLLTFFHTKFKNYDIERGTGGFIIPNSLGVICTEASGWKKGMYVRCVKDTITPINIYRLYPLSAIVGDTMSVYGESFGDSKGTTKFYYNSTSNPIPDDKILLWAENHIRFIVPESAKSGFIYVDKNGMNVDRFPTTILEYKLDTININGLLVCRTNYASKSFRDGTPITYIQDSLMWANMIDELVQIPSKFQAAWCYPGHDSSDIYRTGLLYNYPVIYKGLAPHGWGVITVHQLQELANEFGGMKLAGEALKSNESGDWQAPNTATNASNFSAIQVVYRRGTGEMVWYNKIDPNREYTTTCNWWCGNISNYKINYFQLGNKIKELQYGELDGNGVNNGYPVRLILLD